MVLIKNLGSFNQTPAQFIYSVRQTGLTVGPKQENQPGYRTSYKF